MSSDKNTSSAGLRIKHLQKSYGSFLALVNISFDLPAGKLLVVLGPSGCGKTTLLRAIAGLETIDQGEIWFADKRIDTLEPGERDLALVFQNYALYPHMTVAQNLSFPLKVRKVKRDERLIKVNQVAEKLDLVDQLFKRPAQLSGGQRQRVALGRAIIREPNLFLLDEPLSNLDAELRARTRREIVKLQKSLNTAAVYVTHDQTEALTMADYILILHKGHVRQMGTPDEIYGSPADTFVAGFVGTPRMNFINCRYRSDSMGRSAIHPFDVPFESLYPKQRGAIFSDGEEFILGVRPEGFVIGPIGEHQGMIKEVEFLGDRRVATMSFKNTELTFFTDSKTLKPGSQVNFNLKKDNLHFFDPVTKRRLAL